MAEAYLMAKAAEEAAEAQAVAKSDEDARRKALLSETLSRGGRS